MNERNEKLGYKRLETDEEFLKRVRQRVSGAYITFAHKVKRRDMWGAEYETTESDVACVANLAGERLDEVAWLALKMQRKIVEVFS